MKPKRFSSNKLVHSNSALCNQVFLLNNHHEPPYLRPVDGWDIVGYGKAPWPGVSERFAAVFERTKP